MQKVFITQPFNYGKPLIIICKYSCLCQCLIKKQSTALLLLFVLCFSVAGWIAADGLGLTEKLLNKISEIYGTEAKDRLLEWQSVVYNNNNVGDEKKLEIVNTFFNKAQFLNDIDHWEKEDYWATPVEFLSTNGGDCEDFSIAKYFTLREMGVPVEKMRIMYVKAIELNQAHMVLTYYPSPDAEPVILDNLINEIKLASSREDLVPVYSFNADGLWLAKERGKGRRVGSSKRIKLWQDLGLRIKNQ